MKGLGMKSINNVGRFEGFEKIEDAFKLMDEKPKDLIKPYVVI